MSASDTDTPVRPSLPNGLVAVVKRDCPTCELVAPVLAQLEAVSVISQDDPAFPEAIDGVIDDSELTISWHHDIETVPTLIRVQDGEETERIVGWDRAQWQEFTGTEALGEGLPDYRPGCGSLSVDPTIAPGLEVRLGGTGLSASRVEFATLEDPDEAMYERGWSDGLPLVAPTIERVQRMLTGTTRAPADIVTVVPPDLIECTVEKVAINAVMAGCKPEYLPVVLAALEAVCTDEFNIHGVMATTMGAAPIFIVNGPIRHAIGLNSGLGALGPGARANSTIGRAVMLTIRNVGGARPGGVDRSTHGNFGKIGRCFAELEESSPWEPLSTTFGHAAGTSTVTAYCGAGSTLVVDQLSREPESLARSLAAHVQAMRHPKLVMAFDALLVISPEHARVFSAAGWDRAKVVDTISEFTKRPGSELQRGVDGMAEGIPFELDADLPKTRPGGLRIMHAGSGAGLFSTLFPGWVSGDGGSEPVTREITP